MIKLTIFNNEEELGSLTGLSHEGLIENEFDLDDWDWGIAIDNNDVREFEDNQSVILLAMENYCCGYKKVSLPLRTYYLLYHS